MNAANQFKVLVAYAPSGNFLRLSSVSGNKPFGPSVHFGESGAIQAAYIQYGEQQVGTSQAWIDTGGKHWECYSSPNLLEATISRDFIIEDLEVDQGFPSSRRWHASQGAISHNERSLELFDADAEVGWLVEAAAVPNRNWPNGQTAFIGDIGSRGQPAGATVTFWENGAIRTIAQWEDGAVIGTRSCFSRDGLLLVEQSFHKSGFRKGSWITRFFCWTDNSVRISRIEIYRDFEMQTTIREPLITCILNEAFVNRHLDPLYDSLRELDPQTSSVAGTSVNWEKYRLR